MFLGLTSDNGYLERPSCLACRLGVPNRATQTPTVAQVHRVRRVGPLVVFGLMLLVAACFIGATDRVGTSGDSAWQCPHAWPPAVHEPEPVNRLSPEEQRICDNVNRSQRIAAEVVALLGGLTVVLATGLGLARRGTSPTTLTG